LGEQDDHRVDRRQPRDDQESHEQQQARQQHEAHAPDHQPRREQAERDARAGAGQQRLAARHQVEAGQAGEAEHHPAGQRQPLHEVARTAIGIRCGQSAQSAQVREIGPRGPPLVGRKPFRHTADLARPVDDRPEDGRDTPTRMRRVDFPEPLPPVIAVISPGTRSRSMSASTTRPRGPYRSLTPRSRTGTEQQSVRRCRHD
jgi:hypothetical protein